MIVDCSRLPLTTIEIVPDCDDCNAVYGTDRDFDMVGIAADATWVVWTNAGDGTVMLARRN